MINYVAASNGGIKMFYGRGRGSKGQYKDFVFSTTPVIIKTNYTKYNETITKLWRSEYV